MFRGARLLYGLIAVAFVATLAACGGGSSSSSSSVSSAGPASSQMTASLSTTGQTSVQFGAVAGVPGASITLPVASGAATATLTLTAHLPNGVANPSSSTISTGRANVQSIGGGTITVYGVIALSVSAPVTISSTPAFTFTLPSAPTGTPYVAFFDENNAAAGWSVLLGPGNISGTTIIFNAQTIAPPLTFQSGDTYLFALITTSSPPSSTGLSYTGTKSVNYTYIFGFNCTTSDGCNGNTPAPFPSPVTLTYNVTTNVSPGSSPYPGPTTPGLLDEHVTENDASSLSTSTFDTDSWIGLNTSATPYTVSVFGANQTEPSSAEQPVTTTIYGTPQLVDQFPQSSGASWTNVPTANINYAYADGSTGTRVIASNGTYTDTENLLLNGDGGPAVITENSDTSGSITGPLFSGEVNELQFLAPSGGTIDIYLYVTGGPTLLWATDNVWFNQPPVFYTETDAITTGTSLPASCTPNTFASKANDVNRTITQLDTVTGFIETTVFNSYELNGVPVCMTTTDTQNYAYDEQNNAPCCIILTGPLGLEVITTTESLILQNAASVESTVRQTTSVGTAGSAQSILAAVQAHQLGEFSRVRAVRTRNFVKAARTMPSSVIMSLKGGPR